MPKRQPVHKLLLLAVNIAVFSFALHNIVLAKTSCTSEEDCANQIAKKTGQLADLSKKVDSVTSTIGSLANQTSLTQGQIDALETDITEAEKELAIINKNLEDRRIQLHDKISLRNSIIRGYAKNSTMSDLELFLTSETQTDLNGFGLSAMNYIFNKKLNAQTLSVIDLLNKEISQYESDKKEAEGLKKSLEESQKKLLSLKATLEQQKKDNQKRLADLQSQQKDLQGQIDKLSAQQQKIISEKAGAGTSSVGDYETPSYKLPDPPFSPAFAAMSYGAYSHYNGMSQYGAKGRADAGKSYKDILKFYYKTGTTKPGSFPSKISVKGYGDLDFQYYLYGIAEMPTNWPIEALKAQAIAARTYAYKSGKPICITESCQVFSKSKADSVESGKYPTWKKAVDDTEDEILDNPSTSQYSSTTGGYINNVGWDVTGNWPNDAYEKKAGSPWFYKAWYTQGYSSSSSTCGRSTPWMKQSEMADILNAIVVWQNGDSDDKSHISPVTTGCWGGDPYSNDEMAKRADELGTKYSSISNVDVNVTNNGQTSSITFSTDKGTFTVNGDVFKTVFNLRAPGYVSLRSRLYDFIRK